MFGKSESDRSLHVSEEEGVFVDIAFPAPGPSWGDLAMICGYENPACPPSGDYNFHDFAHLGFTQVDDFFGIPAADSEGDDVIVWLYPMVHGQTVYHHPGPFDAIQLQYNVLRNRAENAAHFLECVAALSQVSSAPSPELSEIRAAIEQVTEHWRSRGVEPGSDEALMMEV